MNERDKIIEIINSIIPGRNVFYGEREYTVGDIADELIKNNIGDVESYKIEAEYWEKSYNEEHIKYVNFVKGEARDMKSMMESRDEWKRKAEVAENILKPTENNGNTVLKRIESIEIPKYEDIINNAYKSYVCLYQTKTLSLWFDICKFANKFEVEINKKQYRFDFTEQEYKKFVELLKTEFSQQAEREIEEEKRK